MTKALVFDTGPIITLAMNNLLWILKPLKEKFKGEFYITKSIERECIERPLTSKKFKFEALQILKLKQEGILKSYKDPKLKNKTQELLKLSNSLFKVHGNFIKNVQYAEIEAVGASLLLNAKAVVIDEFITRTLLETPLAVKRRMEKKMHEKVYVENENIKKFQQETKEVRVIRSVEMVTIAYELGLLNDYSLKIPEPKKTLLEALLWAVKLNGCSISEKEIKEIRKLEAV